MRGLFSVNKKDAKLKWLAERGIESEAYALSCEILDLPEKLTNNVFFLPKWSYLMQVSGQMEQLARHLQFLESLDKKTKKS